MTSEIQIKRGTDTARTDGTLGTPAQGEPIYTTDTKALFIGDGSTAGAIPATVPATVLQLTATTSQNINALATDNLMLWDAHNVAWGVDLTHSTTTDKHKITVNTAGVYEMSVNLALEAQASVAQRYNGIMRVRINDTSNIGSEGKGGYIRDGTDQDETSLSITTFIYEFSAADYFWVKVDRESSVTTQVDTTARASIFYIKRIK